MEVVSGTIPPKTLGFEWIIRDVPQRVIVYWVGRHALLELDDIDGILDVLAEMRIVDELEDCRLAEILDVLPKEYLYMKK